MHLIEPYPQREKSSIAYWTWERIHTTGRKSYDAGVRMQCEKLATKVIKNLPLIQNDIYYLERLNEK
jgi:hypothetical protein